MPVPMPMRLVCASAALLLVLATACSGDSPAAGSGDDTNIDGGGGDINTDLFTPGDGGFDADGTGDDAIADVESDGGGGGGDALGDSDTEYLGRYDDCGFGGPQCEPPLTCVGNCQLPCSAGCPEGEECIDLGGFGSAGVCGVRGGEGDPCDITMGQFCDEGLNCVEGECAAPTVSGEGEACGGFGEQCAEGLSCVFTGLGQGICQATCGEGGACDEGEVCIGGGFGGRGNCFEDCDPTTDPECSDNVTYECRTAFGSSDAACLPRIGEPPGDVAFGEPCGGDARCAEGLFCPGLQGAYCTKTCAGAGDCPTEPAGSECVNLVVQGVCAFTCPGGDDSECPEGMTCNDLFGQQLCAWP